MLGGYNGVGRGLLVEAVERTEKGKGGPSIKTVVSRGESLSWGCDCHADSSTDR